MSMTSSQAEAEKKALQMSFELGMDELVDLFQFLNRGCVLTLPSCKKIGPGQPSRE